MESEVAAEQQQQQKNNKELFEELDNYPWGNDAEFQVSPQHLSSYVAVNCRQPRYSPKHTLL